MGAFRDLTGLRFGRLVAIKPCGKDKWGKYRWLTKCDCGNEHEVSGGNLIKGEVVSCGCQRKITDLARTSRREELIASNGVEPSYLRNIYFVYNGARARCRDDSLSNYHRYGGRGIEFNFDDFDHFLREVGSTYEPGKQLDRINNDGHYEPGNVRWATRSEQCRNTNRNVYLTNNGVTKLLVDWALELGVSHSKLTRRYQKYGKDDPRVFTKEDLRKHNGRKPSNLT